MKSAKFINFFLLLVICGICFGGNLENSAEITVRQWITENPPDVKNLAGKVCVIEFWATWCLPCAEAVPNLIKLNAKYKNKGLELISLSQDKSAQKVRQYVREKGINYHVAIDNGTADWFDVKGYPTVVVVNHQGKVAWHGYPWSPGFEKAVAKAIAKAPPPLLAGVDLGAFDHLRENLCGGKGFAESYRKIKSQMNNQNDPKNSVVAKQIVETIDQRISQKIHKADTLRATDLRQAYNIYAELVAKYDGIEVAEPAKVAYLELKTR